MGRVARLHDPAFWISPPSCGKVQPFFSPCLSASATWRVRTVW